MSQSWMQLPRILSDGGIHASVVMYLCWFNRKTKYEQDTLVFEWFKYAGMKRTKKVYLFRLPYIDDGTNVVPEAYTSICFARGD